jgi:hypothetical protein
MYTNVISLLLEDSSLLALKKQVVTLGRTMSQTLRATSRKQSIGNEPINTISLEELKLPSPHGFGIRSFSSQIFR